MTLILCPLFTLLKDSNSDSESVPAAGRLPAPAALVSAAPVKAAGAVPLAFNLVRAHPPAVGLGTTGTASDPLAIILAELRHPIPLIVSGHPSEPIKEPAIHVADDPTFRNEQAAAELYIRELARQNLAQRRHQQVLMTPT
jgi:hypothetical protein